MFRKLKQKIEEGGSSMTAGALHDAGMDRSPAHGPGIASPIRSPGASPLKFPDSACSDYESVSSEVSEVRATTSKEDLFKKILKKNEQIKKLETKITDLAAKIRERNKSIQRLETAVQTQRIEQEQRVQELEVKLRRSRSSSGDPSSPGVHSPDPLLRARVQALEKENARLQGEVRAAQQQTAAVALESEADELASVREVLSITQKDLESSQSHLEERDRQLSAAGVKQEGLEKEIQSLMVQIGHLTTTNERLEEVRPGSSEWEEKWRAVSVEKEELGVELEAMRGTVLGMQQQQDALHHQHKQYQIKMEKEVAEKEAARAQLSDRVQTLEQRIQQADLSGDERLTALQRERGELEDRVHELSEQLSTARLTGSERSAQLQLTVSQLQACLDQERVRGQQLDARVARLSNDIGTQKQSMQQEITSLQQAIEKKEQENVKKTRELRLEHLKEKQGWLDSEKVLKSSAAHLEAQVEQVSQARQQDAADHQLKLTAAVSADREQQADRLEQLTRDYSNLDTEYKACSHEKDALLVRNAALSQEYEAYKRRSADTASDRDSELQHKNAAIAGLESVLQDMEGELKAVRTKVEELERAQTVAITDVESAEVGRLQTLLTAAEDQLNDRNKTIKKQQQRLGDLKKTLQRELNVQALPNDDMLDLHRDSKRDSALPHGAADALMTNGYSAFQAAAGMTQSDSAPSLPVSSSATVHVHRHSPLPPPGLLTADSHWSDVAIRSPSNDIVLPERSLSRGDERGTGGGSRTGALTYQRDINFDYLRHVVLKFMLSRETEAVHLIKAVAVLLDFTTAEQQLLRDTLSYKMSWFGTRPKLGQGQYSKYVPPTF